MHDFLPDFVIGCIVANFRHKVRLLIFLYPTTSNSHKMRPSYAGVLYAVRYLLYDLISFTIALCQQWLNIKFDYVRKIAKNVFGKLVYSSALLLELGVLGTSALNTYNFVCWDRTELHIKFTAKYYHNLLAILVSEYVYISYKITLEADTVTCRIPHCSPSILTSGLRRLQNAYKGYKG